MSCINSHLEKKKKKAKKPHPDLPAGPRGLAEGEGSDSSVELEGGGRSQPPLGRTKHPTGSGCCAPEASRFPKSCVTTKLPMEHMQRSLQGQAAVSSHSG